jgi:hypothetical protein
MAAVKCVSHPPRNGFHLWVEIVRRHPDERCLSGSGGRTFFGWFDVPLPQKAPPLEGPFGVPFQL